MLFHLCSRRKIFEPPSKAQKNEVRLGPIRLKRRARELALLIAIINKQQLFLRGNVEGLEFLYRLTRMNPIITFTEPAYPLLHCAVSFTSTTDVWQNRKEIFIKFLAMIGQTMFRFRILDKLEGSKL